MISLHTEKVDNEVKQTKIGNVIKNVGLKKETCNFYFHINIFISYYNKNIYFIISFQYYNNIM